MAYETLDVRALRGTCRIRLDRPAAGNALNAMLIGELREAVRLCRGGAAGEPITIIVIEGAHDVFSTGGDFEAAAGGESLDPALLYDLWTELAAGPFVSIALVRGRANAGGVGLAAACDLVFADRTATFGLSELLFGLFPACVLPFLVRRTGVQKAHSFTLLTRPMGADEALACGLADAVGDDVEAVLNAHLPRLQKLSGPAIGRYKTYLAGLTDLISDARPAALEANRRLFADPTVRRNIERYVAEMKFPWEE